MNLPSGKIELSTLTLWLIFLINPFVDAVTGFIVLSDEGEVGGLGSPSQLYRLALSVLMLVQIRRRSHLLAVVGFVLYLICLELFNFAFHGDTSGLLVGITYSYKLAFGLLMFFVLDRYLSLKQLTVSKLIDLVVWSGTIYSVVVLVSDLAGISFSSYMGSNLGSRGVFASANGLGIYVGVCSLLAIYRYHNRPDWRYLLFYGLMGYVLMGLMTRAGIGMLAIGLVLWFVRMPWKRKVPILIVVAVLLGVFWEPVYNVVAGATEMITYRYANSDISIHSLFIGGRQYLFDRASAEFTTEGPLWYRIVFGGGYFMSFRNPFDFNYAISSILEADAWDVFYMFGIVGCVVYLWLLIYPFMLRKRVKHSAAYIIKTAWLMIFFHSALAGHVIQNGMSVMAMVSLLLILKYRVDDAS